MPTLEEYQKQTVDSLAALGIKVSNEDLVVPSVGVDFGADSFIAKFTIGRHYRVSTEEDYVSHNQNDPEYIVPQPDLPRVELGGYYQMFYASEDVASKVNEALTDGEYKPRFYWTFTAPTNTVKNTPDLAKFVEGFGDTLVFWVRIVGLDKGSKKYPRKDRHEYNFISLPAAVQAVADLQGYEVPAYDLSALSAPDASDEFNEEFFIKNFGHADGTYDGSVFSNYRTALWAALGEPDSQKSAIKGSKTVDKKGKERPSPLATESEKLSNCLMIAQGQGITLWSKLIRVPNPACEVFEKQPPKTLALTEIYQNEEHATLVGQADLAERGVVADASSGDGEASHPPTAGWGSAKPAEIVAYLRENGIIPLPEGTVAPPDRARLATDSFLKDYELLVQWDAYAKENG